MTNSEMMLAALVVFAMGNFLLNLINTWKGR